MADSPIDGNRTHGLGGASSADDRTFVEAWFDPSSHRLLVDVNNISVNPSGTVVVAGGTITIAGGTVAVTGVSDVTVSDGTIRVSSGTVTVAGGTMNVKIEDTAGNTLTSTGNALDVNLKTSSIALPISGTVNVSDAIVVGAGTIRVSSGTVNVSGDIASGATDSGNPVKIGGQARTTNPTAVSDGQRVDATFDKVGRQLVVGAARTLKASQFTTINNSTAETTVVTAIASTFNDVYGVIAVNRASAANVLTFKDGIAGTTRFELEVPATDTRGFMLPVDSGFEQIASGTAWTATCSVSGSITISVLYVKNI